MASSTSAAPSNVAEEMRRILEVNLSPLSFCDIINESYMHSVPKDSQTHFKVFVVSEKFQNVMTVQRHRLVYSWTKSLMRPSDMNPNDSDYFHKIHALSIVAKTPEEWERDRDSIPKRSPACLGGEKRAMEQRQQDQSR
jgi:BolA protein